MSDTNLIVGVVTGFNEVGQGFSSAVKTIGDIVGDAYRVNVTLWDGKPDDGDNFVELLSIETDNAVSDESDSNSSVETATFNAQDSSCRRELLRYCHHYGDDSSPMELIGLGLFSVLGGIFYLPWRILKDSVNSVKFQVGIGVNQVFFPNQAKPKPKDLRTTAAKMTGIFGTVIGIVLRAAIYIIGMLGFSPFGYHYLAKAFQQSFSFLFGLDYSHEIKAHDRKLYNHPEADNSKVASMTLFLCEFNLAKLSTLLVYGLAGVFAGVFGSKQSWGMASEWIKLGHNKLFGHDTKAYNLLESSQEEDVVDHQTKKSTLKFLSHFGLFPWLAGIAVYLCFAVFAVIAFSIQAIWKLTFGNIIRGEGGYDGYLNRLYYYTFHEQDSAKEQIEQKLFSLLRALTWKGEIEEKYNQKPEQILTDAKQLGFGHWILNGFLYDVRKAATFGHNNLTEKVIIAFTKTLTAYVKNRELAGQNYTAIASSFFQSNEKQQCINKVLSEEIKDKSKRQEVEKVATFIERLLFHSKQEVVEPANGYNDETELEAHL